MPRKLEPRLLNRVRELRTDTGMTQQEIADQLGITRQTIVALERGGYTPSLALALRIAQLFETAVDDIFWFEGST
ncbi:helix-turn-helix transcriptional regulator [Rubinisphaera margarita]|uniref:helix-turn-helix transcriptional regulator n=1 Tax=Rubinisphaera margarita TaxID=2909586 RepID=UPI001EE96EA9|nr:helix-turn-helix transcriptional regulator [Rubinisphaera margarita]MCG6157431.1 helix-turn-helix transcriptional regulator [Rubinisphaera margarita]